jgi:hypothetical protein
MKNLLVKIKYKLKSVISVSVIKIGLYSGSPCLAAVGLLLSSSSSDNKVNYRVLVIGRSIFADDIKAMLEFSGQIKYLTIHLERWRLIFDYFVNGQERQSLEERDYHVSPHCLAGRQNYYNFLKKVFPYLKKWLSFQACLTGNILYTAQQEWAKVCEENNVPFIVLHKEAIVLPEVYQNFLNNYRNCKFFGSKILFYNRQCQEGFLSLNIEGLAADKTALVGIPRLDFCFAGARLGIKNAKQIVFFSFMPRFSFRFLISDENVLAKIDQRGTEFFKWIMEFARRHDDYEVIIKTKMAEQYFGHARKILADNFKEEIKNLVITREADPSQLIKDSAMVIGFNSTTLIEALIADKMVISPHFEDIVEQEWTFFEGYESLIKYAKNFEELEEAILNKNRKNGYDENIKRNFLEKYVATAEGNASARAEKEIIKTINEKQKI